MPIFEALPRGVNFNIKKEKVWLDFNYERIPSICKWCGYLDHHSNNCNHRREGAEEEDETTYGEWMLFQPPKKTRNPPTKKESGERRGTGPKKTDKENETIGTFDLSKNLEEPGMEETQEAVLGRQQNETIMAEDQVQSETDTTAVNHQGNTDNGDKNTTDSGAGNNHSTEIEGTQEAGVRRGLSREGLEKGDRMEKDVAKTDARLASPKRR